MITIPIMINTKYDINIEIRHKSKDVRRTHQKKTSIDKKKIILSRKKMSKLITRKINKRVINKVYEQFNYF